MEIAVVGATAVVTVADGSVTRRRVAMTALAPTIRRVPGAEAALVGTDGGCGRHRGRRRGGASPSEIAVGGEEPFGHVCRHAFVAQMNPGQRGLNVDSVAEAKQVVETDGKVDAVGR